MTIDYSDPPEPPSYDSCDTPALLAMGNNPISTEETTSSGPDESGDCDSSGNAIDSDAWHSISAPGNGEIIFSTNGNSGFQPKTFVYESCPAGPGEHVACTEPGGLASIPCTAGETYLVRIGSADGSTGTGTIFFLFNEGETPCPGDCGDGNGVIDVNDLLALLDQYGAPGDCDIDGNGNVNVNDLLEMLGVYGDACP